MNHTILEILRQDIDTFSGAQKRVADYILKYPSEVAFMTIERLAHESGSSVATIMRLAYALRYEGYSDMQKDLQKIILHQVSHPNPLPSDVKTLSNNKLLMQCAEMQIENIRRTVKFISDDVASKSVEMLLSAKKVYITGLRSSLCVAHYLNERLNRIGVASEIFIPESGQLVRTLRGMDSDCLLIAISFPRYTKRVLEITKAAKANNAKVLAITDGLSSPLASVADLFIPCSYAALSFHSSAVGADFVADYLVTAVSLADPQRAKHEFETIGKIVSSFNANILK